VDRIK